MSSESLYRRSVLLIVIGGACLSLLGIGTRMMDAATNLQIVFYRGLGQAVFLGLFLLFMRRANAVNDIKNLGLRGALIVFLMAGASICIVLAVQKTTVANALLIIALVPIAAATLAWLFLGEMVTQRTLICIAISILGIAFIVSDGLSSGGLIGMAFAFAMMLLYASAIVIARASPEVNMLAVCALVGVLLMVMMAPFIENFSMSTKDLLICIGLGVFQVGIGTALVFIGAQHVPAAQVSVLALLEVVLNPIWVWIGVGEVPSNTSLIGGAIVLASVLYLAMESIGTERSQ